MQRHFAIATLLVTATYFAVPSAQCGLPHAIRTVRLCALDCELPLELDRADVPECRVAA